MTEKRYRSETLTVTWNPELCIHSENCWRGLGSVFQPRQRPWIDVDGADDEAIADQIDACPSGALGYERHDAEAAVETDGPTQGAAPESAPAAESASTESGVTVQPTANGPYEVLGEVTLLDADGTEVRKAAKLFLCRCGESKAKPFCDGSHKRVGFQG